MHFSTVADWLAPARLDYACSAHLQDHVDALNLTQAQQRFLAELPDPVFRESVRDFMVNQQFRRDYWVRGARRLSALEQAEALRAERIILAAHRPDVNLKVKGALGEASMNAEVYGPVLDCLADHEPRTLAEIEQALSGSNVTFPQMLQVVVVLSGTGQLHPAQDDAAIKEATGRTRALNNHLLDRARGSDDITWLASPVTGGGIRVNRFQQLFLLARQRGHHGPEDWGRFAWDLLAGQGQRLVHEGRKLETPEDNQAELTRQAREFEEKRLPALRALKIA